MGDDKDDHGMWATLASKEFSIVAYVVLYVSLYPFYTDSLAWLFAKIALFEAFIALYTKYYLQDPLDQSYALRRASLISTAIFAWLFIKTLVGANLRLV